MKFVHTADVHLGRKFEQFGDRGELRRGDLRKAFANGVDLALAHGADLFLVVGDLFDSDSPPETDIEFVHKQLNRLAEAGVRAFLAPGNHDPCVRGSLWEREFATLPGRHHIFSSVEFEEVVIEELGCSVIGCCYDSSAPNRRPLAQLDLVPSQKKSVLMVHGSLEAPHQEFSDQPISMDELLAAPFNYIALGHFHMSREVHKDRCKACFYPGTPEGLTLDDRGAGPRYAVAGEIAADGSVSAELREVQSKIIEVLNADCSRYLDAGSLEAEIRGRASPERILRVNLRGSPSFEVFGALDERKLKERFEGLFYLLKIDGNGMGIPGDIPRDGRFAIGRAVNRLIAEIESCGEEKEHQVWRAALDQLLGALDEAKRG